MPEAQINIGAALFMNESNTLSGAYQANTAAGIPLLPDGALVRWESAAYYGYAVNHMPTRRWLDIAGVTGAALPAPLSSIICPNMDVAPWAGTATGGGLDYLDDTSKAWVTNSLAGAFVRLRPGGGIEQGATQEVWGHIVSNTATRLTIAYGTNLPGWGAGIGNGSLPVAGDLYIVYSGAASTLTSWRFGSPPDWTGAQPGDLVVSVLDPGTIGTVDSVAEAAFGRLVMASQWQSPSRLGAPFLIQRDFTALGLPRFNAGDRASLGMLTRLSDRADYLLTHRSALLALAATQTLSSGGTYPVSWPIPLRAPWTVWTSGVPSRIVFPSSTGISKVSIRAQAKWADTGTGRRELWLRKNGSLVLAGFGRSLVPAGAGVEVQQIMTAPIDVVSGDYFELMAFHDTGSSLGLVATETWIAAIVEEIV